jgi:hypothetical protein
MLLPTKIDKILIYPTLAGFTKMVYACIYMYHAKWKEVSIADALPVLSSG